MAAQALLELHGAAGLLLLPRPPQVGDDALELLGEGQLSFLLNFKALLGSFTFDASRSLG
jgi:hypothetical protein